MEKSIWVQVPFRAPAVKSKIATIKVAILSNIENLVEFLYNKTALKFEVEKTYEKP